MGKHTYNKKHFLLPDSHRSMSCYHAKVMEDGIMKLTIHDCKRSVQFQNNLNNKEEVIEALDKLNNLAKGVLLLKKYIKEKYEKDIK